VSPLPCDLTQRHRLYASTLVLLDRLSIPENAHPPPVNPWNPPTVFRSQPCPAELQPPSVATGEESSRSNGFMFISPLVEYNVRLAQIAQAVKPLEKVLLSAGLSKKELVSWRCHWVVAGEVLRCQDGAAATGRAPWFLPNRTYLGGFGETTLEQDEETQKVLDRCQESLERLRVVARRIERTVSPQAVLDRVKVSCDRTSATLDGKVFRGLLPSSEGAYLEYLRGGAGNWVTSKDIAERESLREFKVIRALKSLKAKHPKLALIITANRGAGGRIVLPLPAPERHE
jgi:hypothetical protein